MYVAPGQGQTTPWGQMLMSTESPYHLSFKTISLKYDFKHILNDFIHVYSPRAGTARQSLGDNILMSTESPYHFAYLLPV